MLAATNHAYEPEEGQMKLSKSALPLPGDTCCNRSSYTERAC
jgi:hypothetical protein